MNEPAGAAAPDEVFLTGATGFIGSHVLAALLERGYHVRALVRSGARALPSHPLLSTVAGDLARPGDLTGSLSGCRFLVHTAALYSFAPRDRRMAAEINVRGTAGLLEAARIAGVQRAVVTSSSATVGPAPAARLADEHDWALPDGSSAYHDSKIREERAVLAAQLDTVLVLPTMPVGPGDWKPTPTGKMIVDFMRGRITASLGGGVNVVPVEDVAQAHLLALENGRSNERYLAGGENVSLDDLWGMLAQVTGRPAPQRHLPYRVAWALGWIDEVRCRTVPGAVPLVPLEGVHMAQHNMWVSSAKAERELGYHPGPVLPALERAGAWYRGHYYAR